MREDRLQLSSDGDDHVLHFHVYEDLGCCLVVFFIYL